VHGRRDAVGGEHHDRALGHLVGFVDEHGAGLGERVDDMPVVHDLVTHVHRGAVLLQRAFDGFHGGGPTPAQYPRGSASSTRFTGDTAADRAGGTRYPMFIVGGMAPRY